MADENVSVQITGSQTVSAAATEATAALRAVEAQIESLKTSAAAGVRIPQTAFALLHEEAARLSGIIPTVTSGLNAVSAAVSDVGTQVERSRVPFAALGREAESTIRATERMVSGARAMSAAAGAAPFVSFIDLNRTARAFDQVVQQADKSAHGVRTAFDSAVLAPSTISNVSRQFDRLGSDASRVAHGIGTAFSAALLSPAALNQARAGIAELQAISDRAAHGVKTAFDTAFASPAALRSLQREFEKTEESSNRAGRGVGHIVAAVDELQRGQHGAFMSTLGASMRDAGLSAGYLYAGLAAIVGVGIVERFAAMTVRVGEMAEKTEIAANAAGMSVSKFSELQRVMQLAGVEGGNLTQVFGTLSGRVEQALENPASQAAGAFHQLGISGKQLQAAMSDLPTFIELLRSRFAELPPTLERTEAFRAALGRGFQQLVPYLQLNDRSLQQYLTSVHQSGSVLNDQNEELKRVAIAARELSQSWDGLRIQAAALVSSTGVIDWLKDEVQELRHATEGWRMLGDTANEAVKKAKENAKSAWPTPQTDPLTGMPVLTPDQQRLHPDGVGAAGWPTPQTDPLTGMPVLTLDQQRLQPQFGSNLQAMIADAAKNGVELGLGSGRRSFEEQAKLWAAALAKYGSEAVARLHVAPPGRSMHNLGLADDLRDLSTGRTVQAGSAADRYLAANAGRFGLTRPMSYEPWHVEPLGARGGQYSALQAVGGAPVITAPQTSTQALAAGPYDPAALQRELTENVRILHEETALREAEYAKQIAAADQNKARIEQISAERAKFVESQVQNEAAMRQRYADKALAQPEPDAAMATRFLDTSNVQRSSIEAQTRAVEAQNALRREGVEAQINQLRAQLAGTRNEEDRLQLTRRIADLEASLNDRARGSVIIAEEQARATQHRVDLLERAAEATRREGEAALRTYEAQNKSLVDQRKITPQTAALADIGMVQQLNDAYQRMLQLVMDQAIALKDTVLQEKVRTQAAEANAAAQAKVAQLVEKVDEANKQATAHAQQAWKQFFEQVGSGFENFMEAALLRTQTFAQAVTSLARTLGQSAFKLVGDVIGRTITTAITGSVGQSLGEFLAQKVGGLLNIGTSAAGATASATAISTAMTTAGAASATAIGTAMTTAGATAAAAIGAAMTAGGAGGGLGSAAGAAGAVAIAALSGGGIIPSAAGGMLSDGGTLSILHPQEMVLPANISNGLQGMISRNESGPSGPSVNLNYSPSVTGYHPYATRSSFESMLRQHGGTLVDHLMSAARSNFNFA